MINKKINNKGCVTSFTNCIKYDGQDIPCLGIKNGDYINQVVCTIVDKICEVSQPQDLSTLSITCLIEKFTNISEPLSKTVLSYLQLLVNNQCTLKDLIDAINLRIDGITNKSLILDLKCLGVGDGSIQYEEQTVLQILINETCAHRLHLTTIDGRIVDLQTQINNIPVYTEPKVSSCLFTNKTTSQAVVLFSNDYCVYKPKVGTISDIDIAISRQCDDLAALFATDSNFTQNPQSLANSVNNLWIAFCNLSDRVKAIETTCCAPSCDKIKLGYIHAFDAETRELSLSFTSGSGTIIPNGFVDCGSEFIIKDCEGNIILATIKTISTLSDVVFNIPTGYCINNLTISIKTNFCLKDANNNIIMSCKDCYSKTIKIQSECCSIKNTDDQDIIITYTTTIL